jgi:hypothetical protein
MIYKMSIDDNPHLPSKRTFSKAGLFLLGQGRGNTSYLAKIESNEFGIKDFSMKPHQRDFTLSIATLALFCIRSLVPWGCVTMAPCDTSRRLRTPLSESPRKKILPGIEKFIQANQSNTTKRAANHTLWQMGLVFKVS